MLGPLPAVALAAAVLATGAGASALSAFHTPDWAAQCDVVGEETPPVVSCSLPRTGFFVSMGPTGRSSTGFNPKDKNYRDVFAAQRLLGFGRYWAFGSRFGCVSRTTGLNCWNRAGHGWWLGRSGGYRLF